MKLLIVAGEESGNLHAANLCLALRQLNPEIKFVGLGGQRMEAAGVTLLHNLVEKAVVGFWEPLKQLGFFSNLLKELTQFVAVEKPDAIILVDYPGFNLRFAKRIKQYRVPIIYYISPQVWAWGQGRVKTIAKLVDLMLVIFLFEKEIYSAERLSTEFVGHPLLDIMKIRLTRDEVYKKYQLNPSAPIVTLLPGSRKQEITTLLPIMLSATKIMQQKQAELQFILLLARENYRDLAHQIFKQVGLSIPISVEDKYDIRAASDVSLVASGTATLEGAIVGTPMIVIYKVSFLTGLFARWLIRIPNIALVNVVAGNRIVPELIQNKLSPQALANETLAILSNPDKLTEIKTKLAEVKNKLGTPGASSRAAQIILNYLLPSQSIR